MCEIINVFIEPVAVRDVSHFRSAENIHSIETFVVVHMVDLRYRENSIRCSLGEPRDVHFGVVEVFLEELEIREELLQ